MSRWEDCGRRCGEKASCQFWVWSSPRAGRPGTCALLDGFGTKIFDPKAVAGRWDCKYQSTGLGRDILTQFYRDIFRLVIILQTILTIFWRRQAEL